MNTIEVVCAIMENDQGQLWIGKRRSKVADGMWEFPGGKVEHGETNEEACIREIKEELALDIAIDGFITDVYDTAFDPVIHVSAYRVRILGGKLHLSAHKEGCWVHPKELYSYEFQKADRALLDALQ